MAKKQEGLFLFFDIEDIAEDLTDAQLGQLMRAAFAFQRRGERMEFADPMTRLCAKVLFSQLERFSEISRQRKAAADRRWSRENAEPMQNDAKPMQTDAVQQEQDAPEMQTDAPIHSNPIQTNPIQSIPNQTIPIQSIPIPTGPDQAACASGSAAAPVGKQSDEKFFAGKLSQEHQAPGRKTNRYLSPNKNTQPADDRRGYRDWAAERCSQGPPERRQSLPDFSAPYCFSTG